MRIPHIYTRTESVDPKKIKEIEVDIQPEEYIDDLGLFEDKKEYIKWLQRMKKMIRDSREYVDLIYFLKHKRGMDHCGVHPNLSIDNGFRIELHHTPFCLEDIVNIVTNKRLIKQESVKMTDIAHEVMELHYLGLIGLYPVCMICHAFAHYQGAASDDLFIPMVNVYGEPSKFVDLYKDYMTDAMLTKWENLVNLNKGYDLIQRHIPQELIKQYIYVKPVDKKGRESELEVISTDKLITFIQEVNQRT